MANSKKTVEKAPAAANEGRVDLLDNALARRLGVAVSKDEQRDFGSKFRKLWHDVFQSDAWDDGDFMDDVRQATLRGAHPAARLLFYMLLSLVGIFILWASFAPLDEVTHGQGQVIPSGKVQAVGSPEGGVVKEILVRAGDIVEPGQELVRLDDATAAAGVGEKVQRRDYLQANVLRLQAELSGEGLVFPAEMLEKTPILVEETTKLFENRKSELESTTKILREQLEQRRQELNDARSKLSGTSEALKLAQQEYDMTKPYLDSGAISKVDVLRLERAVVEARKERNTAVAAVPAAEAAVREAQGKLEEGVLKFKNTARDELGKLTEEFNRLGAGVQADIGRVDRTVLRSPVRAEVKQVLVNTIGQAVQANANIVELVPLEETLLVEAKVKPQDVAFIRPNLPVKVKISAYDFSIYGGLDGVVESISGDSFTEEKARGNGQTETYFKVQVRTKKNYLLHKGAKLPIKSGMVATADIITGQKTVLQYLLKPINKAREVALTER
ncbi:MAG: HlyD family type I secretion periplasmic adaptor subunit [Proteobacteria bacterium]|nr:HlyD family type I secretion periplasmic adaptor subunit [Pseudomonadota bacterium]NBX86780.1 HlyD family type I secretion periplasmic adaptor subunit [Pseudomonadota bacterium]